MSDELEDQVTELLQFLYACPVGLIELSADGTIGMVNPLAMQLLLSIASDGLVTNFFHVLESYSPELRHIIAAFEAPHGPICEAHRIFVHAGGKNGGADPLVLACTLVKLDDHRFIASLTDISKQMVQERRLKQAETWFATLLDSVNDFAVVSLDRHGVIDGANAAAAKQTGFTQDAMMNRPLDTLDTPENGSSNYSAHEQIAIAQRDGWHLAEGWRKRPNGERYWCQRLVAARSEDDDSHPRRISGYTVILRDVTKKGSDSAKLKELLTTDHLTGACNRAHFFEVAERQRLRCSLQGQPLALIAIDIDHFKQVNDGYGHATGDAALEAVATTCKALLRTNDTFARLGGEEFAVLLPSTDMAAAVRLAERLRTAIGALSIPAGDKVLTITASFGCAVMTDLKVSLSELLAAADTLLYVAKRKGRNRVEPDDYYTEGLPDDRFGGFAMTADDRFGRIDRGAYE
ncbi:MAG: diguanylate cyclase [Oxalobacteraceae bacterium]|nr:MAG: diguanylate cyclase [Oxalobacteraceae bacterium]